MDDSVILAFVGVTLLVCRAAKNMKAVIFLLILLWAGAGCATSRHDIHPDIPFVSLERTGCLGDCPRYVLTLYADGLVKFEGRGSVKKQGVFTKRVSRAAVAQVFSNAESVGFWSMQENYAESKIVTKGDDTVVELPPTDLPACFITVRTATRMKRVYDYWGAPASLRELERLVDATADAAEWIGSTGGRKTTFESSQPMTGR